MDALDSNEEDPVPEETVTMANLVMTNKVLEDLLDEFGERLLIAKRLLQLTKVEKICRYLLEMTRSRIKSLV